MGETRLAEVWRESAKSALTGIPRRSQSNDWHRGRKHFWDPGLPVVHALVPTARSSRELRAAKRVVVWVESQCQQNVFPARDRERRRVREKLRVKLWNFKRFGYVSLEEQAQRNNFDKKSDKAGDDRVC